MARQNTHPGRPHRRVAGFLVWALAAGIWACGWWPGAAWAQPAQASALLNPIAAWWPLLGLLAGTVFVATLAASACAAVLARRRLLQPLAAALAGIDAAGERLASIAGHAGSTLDEFDVVTKAARAAARDTASGVVGLAECQTRQRNWLKFAEADQARVRALADQCERLTEVMPALLGGAVDSMKARGLAGLDDTAMQLRQSGAGIESAAITLQLGLAALHESTARQDKAEAQSERRTVELSRQVALLAELPALLRAELPPPAPGEAPIIAAELAAVAARLDQSAGRIDNAAGALQAEMGALAHIAADHTALQTRSAGVAAMYERLARDLPAQTADALGAIEAHARSVVNRIDGQCAEQTGRIETSIGAAAERLQAGIAALSGATASHKAALEAGDALLRASASAAHDWPQAAAAALLRGIEDVQASAERLSQAAGAATAERIKALDACLGRAVSLGEALPGLVESLADTAAAWPPCASALTEIAARGDAALGAVREVIEVLQDHASAAGQTATAVLQPVPTTLTAAPVPDEATTELAATMSRIARRLEAAQADQEARLDAWLAAPAAQLEALYQRTFETLGGLDAMCARLGSAFAKDPVHAGQTDGIEAALQAVMAFIPRCWENLAVADTMGMRLTAQGDRLAGLLETNEDAACRLVLAAEAAASANMRPAEMPSPQFDAEALLAGLNHRINLVGDAASLLHARAELQEAAAIRVADAALRVVHAAETLGGMNETQARLEPALAVAAAQADQAARTETALQTVMTLLPEYRDGLAVADGIAMRLTAQGDRLAGLLNAHEDAASRLWEAATAAKAEAALAPSQPEPAVLPIEANAALAELGCCIEQVTKAALRLEAHAALQEAASIRVAQAALSVAQAASAAPVPTPGIAAALHAVGENAAILQAAARQAAHDAAQGRQDASQEGIRVTAPATLAAIERSIRTLQGAATAVALASDASEPPAQIRCA